MTGVRRSICDCCWQDFCGINTSTAPHPFCGAPSTSVCPSTLSVEIEIPSVTMRATNCMGSDTSYDWYTVPAYDQAIAVANSSSNRCYYQGTGTESVSFDSYNSDGSVANSWTGDEVEVILGSYILWPSGAGTLNPCQVDQIGPSSKIGRAPVWTSVTL